MHISPALFVFASAIATAQMIVKPQLIESDSPFSQEGKVENVETKLLSKVEVNKVESGVLNSVHYRFYYTDGSGTFAGTPRNIGQFSEPSDSNWRVSCTKDPITDRKLCHMNMKDLWIFASPDSKPIVSVGSEHYPGSSVTLRLDQDTPISNTSKGSGQFSSQVSASLVEQLKSAKSVTTRHMKWPYQSWKDESWDLYGFAETLQYITWAVDHIK